MSNTKKKRLSWKELQTLSKKAATMIKKSGFKPDYIIGITVSGMIPLALLANEFNTKDVATVSARSYTKRRQGKLRVTALPNVDLRGKKVLLVDEIADRGTTLKHISGILTRRYKVKELKTATLVVNEKHCTFWPDYYVIKTDRWVVFPWD